MPLRQAQVLDYRLKREGYTHGLGLPGAVKSFTFEPYATPIVDYSTDINGGNPDRPLVLGTLDFTGDPNLLRKEGVVAGFGVGANGRFIYGEGRFLDYGLGVSYAHSPQHDIGIARGFVGACSKNLLANWWYLDVCANANRIERDIAEETARSVSASVAKLFSSSARTHHQASAGLRLLDDDDYDQNQLSLGLETAHANGLHTALNVTLGAPVDGELVTRQSISGSVGLQFFDRPLRLTAGYSAAEGGWLLGFARDEDSRFFNLRYSVHPRVSVTMGYRQTDSTIAYYDESAPVFGIVFTPVRF